MARKPSNKKTKPNKTAEKKREEGVSNKQNSSRKKQAKTPDSPEHLTKLSRIKIFFKKGKGEWRSPHKSFRRSYREDYVRDMNIPGITHHVFKTFKLFFKNWKLFIPLLIIALVLNFLLVGIMDEGDYSEFKRILDNTSEEVAGDDIGNVAKAGLVLISAVTTGGLSGDSSEASTAFAVFIFMIIWLTTIFLIRHVLAGHKVKLRDGLYNAMSPLISSFLVFVVAVIQCIPIFLLIIAFSAAIQTDFLATPLYALVFFVFAVLMIVISAYLLSSSIIAFVAVSAPGLYPMQALRTASELMMGRRIRFLLRIVALIFVIALVWVIVMLPLIVFDMWMKTFEWTNGFPFIPICLTIMTCLTCIYVTIYLYIYYKWLLNYEEE